MVLTETKKARRLAGHSGQEIIKMDLITADPSGKRPQAIDIAATRARGFTAIAQHLAAVQVLATAIADLDQRFTLATEQTVDDRAALHEAARRLALLLDGGAAR